MLVLSDEGDSVEAAVFGDDPDVARSALVALASAVAELHRSPVDRGSFGGIDNWTIATRESQWGSMLRCVEDLGIPVVRRAVEGERAELGALLSLPGRATALVHGDLGPNNGVLDTAGRCRLVDFEGSGYQHVGLDAAMLRFPFAWYGGRWARMPAEMQAATEAAYREILGWPARDIDDAIAVGCVAMALLRLERVRRIADPGQGVDLAFRRRTQIVSTIDVAADAAREVGAYPATTAWLEDVAGWMRATWQEANAPPYPAFAGL